MFAHVYYQTPEHGASIQEALRVAKIGLVSVCSPLTQLASTSYNQDDMVFLEYPENDQTIDKWIQHAVNDFHGPSVFLVFSQPSALDLFKALMLEVHGYFTLPLDVHELQAMVEHVTAWNKIKHSAGQPDAPPSGGRAPISA